MEVFGRQTAIAAAFAATLAGTLFAAIPASAADVPAPGRSAAVQKLVDCRKLTDSAQRLACYDEATSAFDQAEAKGDIVVVDREQARAVRRQAFGFSLPSISLFERGEAPEEVDRVELKILSSLREGNGKWLVTVEGGQVWRQIDTAELSRNPKPGLTAVIKKAALGSYKMTVGGNMAIKVRRDN